MKHLASRFAEGLWVSLVVTGAGVHAGESPLARPRALALSPDGSRLIAALHDADALATLSAQNGSLGPWIPAGIGPVDVAFVPTRNEVWTIGRFDTSIRRFDTASLQPVGTVDVAPYCERLAVDSELGLVFVSNSFTRSLWIIDATTLEHEQVPLPGSMPTDILVDALYARVFVSLSLSQSIAVVDIASRSVVAEIPIGALPACLVPAGEWVAVCHLADGGTSDTDIRNSVSLIDRSALAVTATHRLLDHATPRAAAWDAGRGSLWVAAFGSDAVVELIPSTGVIVSSVKVGPNPVDVVRHPDGRLFVLNELGDSVTVIQAGVVVDTWTLNTGYAGIGTPELRGERVFSGAVGGEPNTCYSCHPEGHLDGLSRFIAPPNYLGTHINTPSLRAVRWSAPFRRNGSIPSLGLQDADVLEIMLGVPPAAQDLTELIAYLESLGPLPNPHAKEPRDYNVLELHGAQLFQSLHCENCHRPMAYTDGSSHDVGTGGLADTQSLLGLWQSAPYLHDGRGEVIEEVFAPTAGRHLPAVDSVDDRRALAAYLLTLPNPPVFWTLPSQLPADGQSQAEIPMQVFHRKTGRPIAGAVVVVEQVGGSALLSIIQPMPTDPGGRTRAFLQATGQGTADVRLLLEGEPASDVRTIEAVTPGIALVNVADLAGLDFVMPPRSYPRSVAPADYDGDGLTDMFVAVSGKDAQGHHHGTRSFLHRNLGNGTFKDTTAEKGLDREDRSSSGAAWGDYDNDGDLDLYIANRGGLTSHPGVSVNELYRNDGDGPFTDVAAAAGVANAGFGYSIFWFDYDHDGRLDLYIENQCNCGNCGNEGNNISDALYRNRGDGSFDDVTEEVGLATPTPADPDPAWLGGDGGAVGDFDGDGYQDFIKLLIDGTAPSYLQIRNNAGQSFSVVPGIPSLNNLTESRGCAFGDFDNDMDLDLFVVGRGLFRNNGTGQFTDVTGQMGFPFGPYNNNQPSGARRFGHTFVDMNNDGWIDIVAENRAVSTANPVRKLAVFLNIEGSGSFQVVHDVEVALDGASDPKVGLAAVDYNDDGLMDIFLGREGPGGGQSQVLFQNRLGGDHHFLRITLEGSNPLTPRSANGARIIALSGDLRQMREIRGGENASGCADYMQHVGLVNHAFAERVMVRWPGGNEDVYENVAGHQHIRLREGDPKVHPIRVWFDVDASASPASGEGPLTVQFSSTVLHGEGDVVYVWDFGDGTIGAGPNPVHVYSQVFAECVEYMVTVTVRDDLNRIANAVTTIVVVPKLGDVDHDDDVDLLDYALFLDCVSGPGVIRQADCPCAPFDFDGDRDVDLADFAGFQQSFETVNHE